MSIVNDTDFSLRVMRWFPLNVNFFFFFKRFDLQGAKHWWKEKMRTSPVRTLRPLNSAPQRCCHPSCPPRAAWCCLSLENSAKLPRGRILDMGGGGKLWFPISPILWKMSKSLSLPEPQFPPLWVWGAELFWERELCIIQMISPGTRTASYSLREMSQLHPYPKEQPIQARFRQSSLLYGLCSTCFCLKRSDLCTVCLARMKAPGQQRPCLCLLRRT